jgi:hypothetical protein
MRVITPSFGIVTETPWNNWTAFEPGVTKITGLSLFAMTNGFCVAPGF